MLFGATKYYLVAPNNINIGIFLLFFIYSLPTQVLSPTVCIKRSGTQPLPSRAVFGEAGRAASLSRLQGPQEPFTDKVKFKKNFQKMTKNPPARRRRDVQGTVENICKNSFKNEYGKKAFLKKIFLINVPYKESNF